MGDRDHLDQELSERSFRIREIVEAVLDRRQAGEAVPDEMVLTQHPDLLPELAEQLRKAAFIQAARRRAAETRTLAGNLTATAAPSNPLTAGASDATAAFADSFPGYQILKEIHRGGQGVVYQAIQKSTKRKVAVKVLREGPFAGPSDRARFEREVQVLGQLNHPNIVAVCDSGAAAGHHFFVMDYIAGRPLDAYIKEKRDQGAKESRGAARQTLHEVLRSFVKICDAVNAAHLRGVIHRDLKPANVRVDDAGEPHVLDFGLAKLATPLTTGPADEGGDGAAAMTRTGQFIGSLPWASPEQAAGRPDQIDIRTDVYSLGVILYQSLTGRFPYDISGQLHDALNNIVHAEPARPSTLKNNPGGLIRAIDDELETIVLKCLHKERDRRYQSAGELGRDLRHYLNNEPIEAKRDSAWYVLRKTLRRYRGPVRAAAAFVLVLAGATVLATTLYLRAETEKTRAQAAERDKERERQNAVSAQQLAEREKKRTEEKNEALRRRNYAHSIALAQNAYEASNLPWMRDLLESCDTDLRGWEWQRLHWLSAGQSQCTLTGHTERVSTAAFSPDGRRIVSGSWDGTLKLWDAATGQELHTLTGHKTHVLTVAFSPDGRRIVSGSDDQTLKIWDAATGQELRTIKDYAGGVFTVAFRPDGRQFVSGSRNKTLKFWDIETGQELGTLRGLGSVHFTPNGWQSVSGRGGRDNLFKLWNAETGQELGTFKGHTGPVLTVALSPNNQRIVSGSEDSTLKLWDAETGRELHALRGHRAPVFAAAFSPDGRRIVSGSGGSTVLKLWDAATGQELRTLKGHTGAVYTVAFSPDGRRIVSGSDDQTLRLWNVETNREFRTLKGHTGSVGALAFSSDGRRFVSGGSQDNLFKLWDAETGQELCAFAGHTGPVFAVAFSPDGRQIVSGGRDKTLKLWDAETGKELCTFKGQLGQTWATVLGHTGPIWAVAFSPSGRRIVSGSGDYTLKLWDIETGQEFRTLKGHTGPVREAAFSPDGRQIVSGGGDHTLKIWDIETGQELRTFKGHTGSVSALALSPDGRQIVSGSADSTLKFWDAETGRELRTLKGHAGPVYAAAFSPDGRRIASGGKDGTLKLWDVETGNEFGSFRNLAFMSLGFCADRIVIGCADGMLVICDTTDPSPEVLERRRICEEARNAVNALFAELQVQADMTERLRRDTTLSPAVRAEALRLVEQSLDDPERLNLRSWAVVRAPGQDDSAYRQALRWAETSLRLTPDNGPRLNTLGLAQYRVGQYEQAVATLTRSGPINSILNGGPLPADVAFLAMSLHQLGRTEEARAALERLRELMRDSKHQSDAEAQAFLREAEALIAPDAPAGAPP